MKKFVKHIFLIIGIVLAAIFIVLAFDYLVIGKQYTYNYQASLIDKIGRLESINEPKIILVGNSNLAFGIKSDIIEEELGMPVVNLGLHGSMGNAFHEQIAKLSINDGDIVIVCHTSYSDTGKIADGALTWVTYDWNEKIFSIIKEADLDTLIYSYSAHLKNVLPLWISGSGNKVEDDTCYSRTAFNKYGDIEYRPNAEDMDTDEIFRDNEVLVPEINDICMERLNELDTYCKDRGATLLVAGYPIGYGQYSTFTESDFEEFQAQLDEQLSCDIISDFTDYFYPYSYFYDRNLHLTDDGAEIRSRQLVKDIKSWMQLE